VVHASVPSLWYPHIGKRLRPTLRGDERLLRVDSWREIIAPVSGRCEAHYYSDVKLATFAGHTLPWPTHILVSIRG